MNGRSINIRLTVWYTALIIAVAASFGTYTYMSVERGLYDEIQNMLSRRIVHLREDVLPVVAVTSRQALAQKIEDIYSPEQNDRFIRISEVGGNVLYLSGRPGEQAFNPSDIPASTGYTEKVSEAMPELRKSQHLLLVGLVTKIDGKDYILEMGTAVTPIAAALQKLVITLLISVPVIILIAAMGGSLLVRRALLPVEAMRKTAEQISFGELHQRLPTPSSGDAIEHLAKTLNQMLERLDQAYQQAARFSADASHELRTPLTVMRSELESLLHAEDLSTVQQDRIGSIVEESERLSSIVENLFSLARLDAGEAKIGHEVFDLSELVVSTIDQMRLLADEKKLSVTAETPQPVFVAGDAARLKQVTVNLFDNAIKYTMTGGSITFAVKAKGSKAVLTVTDNGIGIAPDALLHIFERFYRADKARSRSVHGAGLGLSIVQLICRAHGGTVSATSQENVGTNVTLELPLAKA